MNQAVWQTDLPGMPPPRRGKVRDIYDLGATLLLVATDRLSAYDHILTPGIPDKGKVLTQLSSFWFGLLGDVVPNHLLAAHPHDAGAADATSDESFLAVPAALRDHAALLDGRAVLVRKTRVIPFECVARGYLAGSAFHEYRTGGAVCGIALPPGLERASRLPEPIFTPATKAAAGHDENVDFAAVERGIAAFRASGAGGAGGAGAAELATRLRRLTLALYQRGAAHAAARGLILADTKFEFGLDPAGQLLLIDEVLTPDSSRYWDAAAWRPGEEPASFDKQYVRNWLDRSGWDRESPPPTLPPEIVAGTRDRYLEAFRRLTGREPEL
ncbi:MAG TPA: phosphoribosylaminoimidazolesuccinocarboxamide synthase [Thermoanaerobaculia bacterium]|nr:phosphoribosylaminoimidazolesuccinocarboxamide synthase [Thermoanaerobaculia bacterium]